jgi:hypothetical protein
VNIKVRKSFWILVKAMVFIAIIYIFYLQLKGFDFKTYSKSLKYDYVLITLAILLMPLNWLMEFFKWKVIVQSITQVKSSKLTHSMLSGISTGMVTPNRIGNFIGRMVYFPSRYRWVLSLGTLYANAAQFMASIIPLLLLFFIIPSNREFDHINQYLSNINIFWISFVILIFLLIYMLVPRFATVKFKSINRLSNSLVLFQKSFKHKGMVLLFLSEVRFLIYSIQFYLLLIGFGADASANLFFAILLMYFFITLTPSLLFGKILIRENYALFFLSPFIENDLIILSASLFIWLLNLALPALIGLFFLLKSKHDAA